MIDARRLDFREPTNYEPIMNGTLVLGAALPHRSVNPQSDPRWRRQKNFLLIETSSAHHVRISKNTRGQV
jgi:hypothetical protein